MSKQQELKYKKGIWILSIAIPTYNRSSNLQTLYEDFIGIVEKKCSGNIEIIICDNSDKKDAKRNQNIFSQTSIRYFKNKKNIGFRRAFLIFS